MKPMISSEVAYGTKIILINSNKTFSKDTVMYTNWYSEMSCLKLRSGIVINVDKTNIFIDNKNTRTALLLKGFNED